MRHKQPGALEQGSKTFLNRLIGAVCGLCPYARGAAQTGEPCVRPPADDAPGGACDCGALSLELRELAERLDQERRCLEQSEEKYRALFEDSIEGIFRTTVEGRFVTVNPAMVKLLGYRDAADLVESVTDIGRDVYAEAKDRDDHLERLKIKGALFDAVSRVKRRDGTEIWVSERSRLITDADGQARFIEGTLVDVTESRRAEDLLRAKIEAEAASRAKSEFLAAMSHEIRTPLNVVAGMTEAVLATKLDPSQRDCLETSREAVSHLLGVINDILDLSRIEAGKLELETAPCDLEGLLRGVARTMRAQALAKGLDFTLDVAPEAARWIVADAARLRQILFNLTGNAVKFTAKGGVALSARLEKKAEGQPGEPIALAFTVSDTGSGIAEEKLRDVFRSYVQADAAASRLLGGSGLGLAITRRLAHLMDGDVAVTSQIGQGSAFTFRACFPPAREPALSHRQAAAPLTDDPSPNRPRRVLLVEDNPANAKVARLHLDRLGHETMAARNGLEALAALRRNRFDLVLMDLEMPEMDGLTAARAIRSDQSGVFDPGIPIVAMTAHALAEARTRCLEAGMDAFLTKPVDFKTLAGVLADLARGDVPAANDRDGERRAAPAMQDAQEPAVLDERAARLAMGVHPEDYPAVFETAVREIRSRCDLLAEAMDRADLEALAMHAHAAKGTTAAMGAYRLRLAAMGLEKAARSGDVATVRQAYRNFLEEKETLLQRI